MREPSMSACSKQRTFWLGYILMAVELHADCTRCAALCCLSLTIDQATSSSIFNKRGGIPCAHLNAEGRCAIYENRARLGFSGCTAYDCYGAGQRTTQEVFSGRSWLTEPHLKNRMTNAFIVMSRIHGLLVKLATAKKWPLDTAKTQTLRELLDTLESPQGWTADACGWFSPVSTKRRQRPHIVQKQSG